MLHHDQQLPFQLIQIHPHQLIHVVVVDLDQQQLGHHLAENLSSRPGTLIARLVMISRRLIVLVDD
jgi:hypothetical protein